jgi:hypothetical protein
MSFAWFVWDRAYRGDAVVRRISWERSEPGPPVLGKREIGIEGGKPGPGRGKKTGDNITRLKNRGTSSAYILARLDRDGHAELAAKVRAGKLSANAAARAIRPGPRGNACWGRKPADG